MKTISLTRGYETIVDDNDYDALMRFKWHAHVQKNGIVYACRGVRTKLPDGKITVKLIFIHQQLMGGRDGYEVDHISRDSLDNRRSNFRWATRRQNAINCKRKTPKSGYRGVYERSNGFQVSLAAEGGRRENVGWFKDKLVAAKAYNEAAVRTYGEFAVLNQLPN